jgi:predicted MPP superfamily phosphohydrolase
MNSRFNPFWSVIPFILFILVDIYIFQAIKSSFSGTKSNTQRNAYLVYAVLSSFTYIAILVTITKGFINWHGWSKNLIVGLAQAVFIGKIMVLPFILIDDTVRFFRWIFAQFGSSPEIVQPNGISRLQFLSRIGLIFGSTAFGGLVYGVVRGAYNYKTIRINLPIPNLPDEFKDLKIVQISDMHIGSFADNSAVHKIVELVNAEKADIVFFTGDLVNYAAKEILPYISILKKLSTHAKVYSILGNHDYGNYLKWDSEKEMYDNFQHLLDIQRNELGWDLLMDEHRIVEKNGKKLAIIGVEYIGHSLRFGKFGNLHKAYAGAETADVQLLLSHDPSHWDKEVSQLPVFKNIHATFAGHTHGFQFGIEIPKLNIQWSPSKYVYPHWAGLYTNDNQHLYVNRGAGFLGYPGRLGISPEISVFQLVKA